MAETSHPVSQAIRSLYEAYPYPQRLPGGGADPYLDLVRSFSAQPLVDKPSFLDAGCGTGVNTLGAAMLYPHYNVYGCDLNRVALDDIRADCEQFQLSNLELREVDLLNFPTDFGPESGFDVIFSIGVIHHTPDPGGILKTLAGRLAPQGVLRLMVYGEVGRDGLYRFANVARRLFSDGKTDWPEQVSLAQGLMSQLHNVGQASGVVPPPLRGPWSDGNDLSPVEFADRYLNPHDKPFSVESLAQMVEEAGLQFLDWFEPSDWNLKALLPELERMPGDKWEQFAIVEQLFDRPKLDLYLVKPGFIHSHPKPTSQTVVSTNPQLFLSQLSLRGRPLQQSARLRLGQEQLLTPQEARVIEALANRWCPLGELMAQWGEDIETWAPVVGSLLDRQLLFAPHPIPE